MIISGKFISVAILLFAGLVQSIVRSEKTSETRSDDANINLKNETSSVVEETNRTRTHHQLRNHKYSSRIVGSRYPTDNVFGIRTFPVSKSSKVANDVKTKNKVASTTENVLDFRISETKRGKGDDKTKEKEKDDGKKKKDLVTASAGGGKRKKEVDDEEEKTLAQQVADGKYGLIQNEIFANGSKRPGILSYKSNTEVPRDTKENLGGLEKDEIWLAEDHILVLRGGNYQDIKENETPSSPLWPPIDDYKAPNRQVKIPKNPDIPPPFPVQLSEDGPVEFIKGQKGPSAIPPILPPLPPFAQESNKTLPLPYIPPPPPPGTGNKTLPFPIPPHLLPPFLSNLPPGATFVAPPDNRTDFDEDDPSIYYPPKYDFYYPQDNTTAVPPGPLVPGIILPPPPDFFSLLENDTDSSHDNQNETDDSINSVTPNTFVGPKYLPAIRKPFRPRISSNRFLKRPITVANVSDANLSDSSKQDKPPVTYVYPENSKHKSLTTTTPSYNSFRTSVKVPANKYLNNFPSPIFVPSNSNRTIYHPLPTTSPKPNHITLPTTKTLPKQIFIITTPETVDKNRIEEIYKNAKPVDVTKYEHISPEIHPLRSLIKPNVTISYNGKYGHLPPAKTFTSEEKDIKIIRGHYITEPPVTKGSKAPSTDINSITVTPIPVVKKIRVQPLAPEKPEVITPPTNPSKATFYFYEEPSTTEAPALVVTEKAKEPSTPKVVSEPTIKTEPKPVTQYYYTTKSTSKTPIRQFLEETFHSSNVLPRKPQIAHINHAEIITHNYAEIPKMKHLNYGAHVSPRPAIKYHYVTENNAVVIPSPKIKDLEIKNSGSSGLQNVNIDTVPVRPAPQPIVVQEPTLKPETQDQPTVSYVATPKPTEYKTADGPFVPSNYYATARPEHIHFTSQEQTLVDDITKNYFTIFGQKINPGSTTPLTPVKPKPTVSNKNKQESGLTYISDDGHKFKIQQVHETSSRKPAKSSTVFYSNDKPKTPPPPPRPPSNFEKYLKELTGEDQRDFIVTGVFPTKIKKGKGFIGQPSVVEGIPSHLLSPGPIVFQSAQPSLAQVAPIKTNQAVNRLKVPYQPTFSTTLRPVVDVEIKPQYVQHISSTAKPYDTYQQPIQPNNVRLTHNFQQYLQEITGVTSPTTTRPVKVKKPNIEYFQNVKQVPYQPQVPDVRPKPIPLQGDILVNYKHPRPAINTEAELLNIQNPRLPFGVSPNIKIVESPDLSRNPNQPYSHKQITFGVTKDFFENLPKSGYFSQPHQTSGNSFVSYNLPGNGGHFYFLTPQIVEKANEEDLRRHDKGYKRVSRNEGRQSNRYSAGSEPGGYSSQIEHNVEDGYSNHDYLRRRRKKP